MPTILITAHLSWDPSPEEDGESKGWVDLFDHFPQLLRALQLVLLQPLLDELFLPLGQHGSAELQGLVLVQLAAFQQNTKILEQGGGLAGLGGHLLETLDGLGCSQDSLKEREEGNIHEKIKKLN